MLTAVDSALMVIDAANGVEAQTRRLIEVCRQRDTPIITFVNKMDREVRDPLDILDEVERELGMPCVPMTWPVGQGKTFGGIINLRTQAMTVFDGGKERRPQDFETMPLTDPAVLQARFGHDWDTALESMELATGASPAFDREAFLAGKQTPVFFGSGVNNFGVMEVLDALVDLAPSPGPRKSSLVVNKQPVEKDRAARRRRLFRRGVQGAGQHGRQPPRPHRLRARGLGQVHAGHEAQGAAHRQGAAPHVASSPSCRSAARRSKRPTRATSSASPRTAACSSATPSPTAPACSSPACPSSRPNCS